jgi:hypothetical protein
LNASDEKSGVNREIHAPFCGEPGGENPPGDRLNKTKDNDSAQDKDLSDTERTELERLRKENSVLRMERDFAKKVATWFAKEQP